MIPKTLVLGLMPLDADPERYLAAGPWCFLGREKAFPNWEKLFTFAPEPLASRALLPKAIRAAQTLAIRLVDHASQKLAAAKSFRARDLPDCYWQTLLLPWLIDLASQIIERKMRCDAMIRQWGILPLAVPVLPVDMEFSFNDEHEFTLQGSMNADFNHWLFSCLLETCWPAKWQEITVSAVKKSDARSCPRSTPGWKTILRNLATHLAFPRVKGLSTAKTLTLSLNLLHKCRTPAYALDLKQHFAFDKELYEILPNAEAAIVICEKTIPQSLKDLHHGTVRKTRTPRLKVASISAQENAGYRQNLAYWKASGNRVAHIQHGGNYGVVRMPCAAELTEYNDQAFFTWGWKKQGEALGNFIPMPSFQLCSEADAWKPEKDAPLIFVGTEMSLYGHRLDCQPTPMQFLSYREAKGVFFSALSKNIRAKALYRPYFPLPGTLEDAAWLLPRFPELGLCQGPLKPQIQKCGLLALDHHGTTLLEAMAANIPCVAYWDKTAWPVTPEFDSLLDMLEQAGIWHSTPEKAAAKVNEIWPYVKEWLQLPEIQDARKTFCAQQAILCKKPYQIWKRKLKSL